MPSPVLRLPWGSRSTTSVRKPRSARQAPRFTAVVVLPTPPFWLATAMRRGSGRAAVAPGLRASTLSVSTRSSGTSSGGIVGGSRDRWVVAAAEPGAEPSGGVPVDETGVGDPDPPRFSSSTGTSFPLPPTRSSAREHAGQTGDRCRWPRSAAGVGPGDRGRTTGLGVHRVWTVEAPKDVDVRSMVTISATGNDACRARASRRRAPQRCGSQPGPCFT